jgi:hypothetical protein
MRGRLTTVTAALAIAGAFTLSAAPIALASSGAFLYHDAKGQTKTINEPQYNHCYQVDGPAVMAVNHTNTTAMLFATPGCRGHYVPVPAGHPGGATFVSVMFLH